MNKNQSENGAVPPQRPVLVVGEYGVLNGGERSFLAVAEHLIARGWRYVAAVPVTVRLKMRCKKTAFAMSV